MTDDDLPTTMRDPTTIRSFVLAGNAILTLQSGRTGQHLTYQIRQSPKPADDGTQATVWFVAVLGETYRYVGILRRDNGMIRFLHTAKSLVTIDSPSFRGFRYFWHHIQSRALPPEMTIRHEGRCGRCGRPLTRPESIDIGIGPECFSRLVNYRDLQ